MKKRDMLILELSSGITCKLRFDELSPATIASLKSDMINLINQQTAARKQAEKILASGVLTK